MGEEARVADRIRGLSLHLLDLAILVKAHQVGLSLLGIWSPTARFYEDDPPQGLRAIVVLLVLRTLAAPRTARSRRTFRFLYHGLTSPVAAGAATGAAVLAGHFIAWTLHTPWAEMTDLGDLGSGLALVLLGMVAGLVAGTVAGLVAAGAARILPRVGLLVGPQAPARLAAALALGATLGLVPELDPNRFWSRNTGLSLPLAFAIGGHACLLLIVTFGWRRRVLMAGVVLGLAAFGATIGGLPAGAVPAGAPRGILLVTVDTLRADHLGCYGYPRDTSPRIDALAAESTLFERAYAPMPSTDPSHVAILTGLLPRTTGVLANGLPIARPDEVRSLAQTCRELGYRTGAITSRAHLDPEDLRLGGFQTSSAPTGETRATEAALALSRARRWLERFGGEPFFLWVHVWDPHAPYDPPREPERSLFGGPYSGPVPRRTSPDPGYTPDELRRATDLYDGEIRYADGHVGRIIDAARARVGRENLLVVVTADHGETLDEHAEEYGYALDHSELLSRQEVHVPLLVCWPGRVATGVRVSREVSIASITPGITELLGGEPTGDVPSLAPLLAPGEAAAPAGPLLLERRVFFEPSRSFLAVPELGVIEDGWLYVENAVRGRLLHRLGPDRHDATNRLEAEPARARRLAERLRVLRLSHPRVEVDVGDLPEDRANALKGLGYGR